jgi:type VI secretion system secreted protein Hcp
MASDYFLKLEGIKGESKDKINAGSIEISSFSWGVSQSAGSVGGAGGSSGRASFQPMRFVAPTTSASAALMLACASGQRFPSGVLSENSPANDGTTSLAATYELSDCVVSEYFVGGPADDTGPGDVDTFSLSFRKFRMTVNGASGAKGVGGWDLATNKKA